METTELVAAAPWVVLILSALSVKVTEDGNETYARRAVALVLSLAAAAVCAYTEGTFDPGSFVVVAMTAFFGSGLAHDALKHLGVDVNDLKAVLPAVGLEPAALPLSPARREAVARVVADAEAEDDWPPTNLHT